MQVAAVAVTQQQQQQSVHSHQIRDYDVAAPASYESHTARQSDTVGQTLCAREKQAKKQTEA